MMSVLTSPPEWPKVTPMIFSLWRQDDNGNRFLVGEFSDRAAAETRLAELTRSLHKQTCWISKTGPDATQRQQPPEIQSLYSPKEQT
jgi:hypothetical protein